MAEKGRVAVVVDSAASLPADKAAQLQVVPMRLVLDGKTYLDGRDLSATQFYKMLRQSSAPATTSAPPPASFLESFRQAALDASSVLCLTVASRFSASFNSAQTAAVQMRDELPGVEIAVLDTESAAGGEGLIALEALRAAARGDGLDQVVAAAREVMPRVRLLAFLDTLYYLWKGGRVPRLAHAGTSLLDIKPLFELKGGEVHTVARPRTRQRATQRLVELMRERVEPGSVHATVMHADSADAAEVLRQQIEAEFPCQELYVSEFTPVMGAHIGPGLLGVAFWSESG
jgi:DegV family protein with EDD domain